MLHSPDLGELSIQDFKVDSEFAKEVIQDYWIACVSRETSLLGRREVLTGKAKFGILGDGKEVPQLALAKVFKKGDWRSGYYRDQTLMFALGISDVQQFFSQLYADADNDPFSGGRQMNAHFATATIDSEGNWLNHLQQFNTSSDISSTGGQMARGLGLAFASKMYRQNSDLATATNFSNNGNEVVFMTIGDASTSEGIFWETLNAAGVLQIPMVLSVWDDGYGISVPKKFQTIKGSISEAIQGFKMDTEHPGWEIIRVKGHNYPALCKAYEEASELARKKHIPVLVHVEDLTQPQGHSTSGSHERYKSKERLAWEAAHDCILKMGEWMVQKGFTTKADLEAIGAKAKAFVKEQKQKAWAANTARPKEYRQRLEGIVQSLQAEQKTNPSFIEWAEDYKKLLNPTVSEVHSSVRRLHYLLGPDAPADLIQLNSDIKGFGYAAINTGLYAEDHTSAIQVAPVPPVYLDHSPMVNGYQILNKYFDSVLASQPNVVAFGEDVGQIGDVNQGFAGLQNKYGIERVFDTGIREWTIMGQAIGLSMRGFRPIAEIQYLDYLIYGLEPLSDDLATLRYRSAGLQCAPAIIRTRGHRLEGIWHAGSPMGMLLSTLRGMYIGVPRNMTQAAGMYNTALAAQDPVLIVECLNGYRLKERLPENLEEIRVPFGVPEILKEGKDITLVTYGSCVRIAQSALEFLKHQNLEVELIDVQTLLPFDLEARILQSLKKTNKLIVLDEDVPGGASAFIMQQVLEVQGGFDHLDLPPVTLTGKAHRPAYGSDGDYYSKPNAEDIALAILNMMHEYDPSSFPKY
ncbi:MAG: transketolase [Saprospiraceae bacterium]|nr:transketolase [Saprospiraceae bacterium]